MVGRSHLEEPVAEAVGDVDVVLLPERLVHGDGPQQVLGQAPLVGGPLDDVVGRALVLRRSRSARTACRCWRGSSAAAWPSPPCCSASCSASAAPSRCASPSEPPRGSSAGPSRSSPSAAPSPPRRRAAASSSGRPRAGQQRWRLRDAVRAQGTFSYTGEFGFGREDRRSLVRTRDRRPGSGVVPRAPDDPARRLDFPPRGPHRTAIRPAARSSASGSGLGRGEDLGGRQPRPARLRRRRSRSPTCSRCCPTPPASPTSATSSATRSATRSPTSAAATASR